ncbi:MAG: hypothetical protein IJC50_04185 [Clostridia bacterium]|nr:hypothetical protein [Clostridia bacterium]
MAKKKKQRNFYAPNVFRPDRDPHGKQKVRGRQLLGMLFAIILAYAVWLLCFEFGFIYIVHVYAVILFASMMAFGVMNRGFSQTLPTAEDIPDAAELEKEIRRRKRGRIFLVPTVAVIVTFMLDIIWLWFLEPLLEKF